MEAKKRTTHRKRSKSRRPKNMSELSRKKSRKSYRRKSRRGLSEMFSSGSSNTAFKAIASGAVGAFVGGFLVNLFPNEKPLIKGLIVAGSAFVVGTALKMPNAAAGLAGAGLFQVVKSSQTMAEPGYLSQADLDSLPEVLAEPAQLMSQASPMALAESPFQFAQ